MMTRRNMIASSAAAIAGGSVLLSRSTQILAAEAPAQLASGLAPTGGPVDDRVYPPGMPGKDYSPVIVPNGAKLPWKVVDGVKVFHMVAEEVDHEFAPGLKAQCWGYNGRVHGPVIEAVDGDRIRIYVTNKLPAATTVHWHAILVPSGMDGVGGVSQKAIQPGETFKYEFTLHQSGTGMYHSHHDEMTQIGLGMTGMFIVHPRVGKQNGDAEYERKKVDRDFAILLHEWRIDPGTNRPNPNEMTDFNILTMNAKAFPGTAPLVVKKGDRVRIRIGNLSAMEHHPIHLHGYHFQITETDAGQIPVSAQWPETTVLVAVGSTRTIEFVANEPGDWVMHCHMTHHTMNQMGHQFPNMIGVKPGNLDQKVNQVLPGYMTMGQTGMADMGDMGMPVPANSIPMVGGKGHYDYITMGGMFTILKVRENLTNYDDPGWYKSPAGTQAGVAAADDLRRDGIDVGANPGAEDSLMGNGVPGLPPPTPDSPIHAAIVFPVVPETAATSPSLAPVILYTCVMHPEVISDKPGTCPKCGMTLVVKK
ncbi:MAG TPA: multicopper oxidase domain-containing protein [Phycisphaerae bacterium]|jgi:FtsP/CotA-like multicopper oxidase with cupredoxin domain